MKKHNDSTTPRRLVQAALFAAARGAAYGGGTAVGTMVLHWLTTR